MNKRVMTQKWKDSRVIADSYKLLTVWAISLREPLPVFESQCVCISFGLEAECC